MDGLQAARLLERMFIDEVHTAITDSEHRPVKARAAEKHLPIRVPGDHTDGDVASAV